jgi:ComF family protein
VQKLELGDEAISVVPVPLFRGKRRERGFNQAELLGRAAMKHLRGNMVLDATSLERTRETASQTGLTSHQRRANMRGAFRVKQKERISGRHILLIDDVCTTGTTVGECARVLLRAGAKSVRVATVARVLKGEIKPVVFTQAEAGIENRI